MRGDYKLPARERGDGGGVHRVSSCEQFPAPPGKGTRRSGGGSHDAHRSIAQRAHAQPGGCSLSYAPLVMQSKLLVSALITLAFNSNRQQQRKWAQAPASCLLWEQEPLYNKEGTSKLVCACAGRRGGRAEDKKASYTLLVAKSREDDAGAAAEEAAKRRLSTSLGPFRRQPLLPRDVGLVCMPCVLYVVIR